MEQNRAWRLGASLREIIKRRKSAVPLAAIQRGCVVLLEQGSPDKKRKAVGLLGRLEARSASGTLVKALGNADHDLRETICYTLSWLTPFDKSTRAALVKLRREDPSIAVRVAATLALKQPEDKDAIATFNAALGSATPSYVRQRAEDELAKMGKLHLPLPENVYTEVSYDDYEKFKSDRWCHFQREVRKRGYIYFETVEQPVDVPFTIPHWYRTKVLTNGEKTIRQQMKEKALRFNAGAQVFCLALSPDGTRLVAGDDYGCFAPVESGRTPRAG